MGGSGEREGFVPQFCWSGAWLAGRCKPGSWHSSLPYFWRDIASCAPECDAISVRSCFSAIWGGLKSHGSTGPEPSLRKLTVILEMLAQETLIAFLPLSELLFKMSLAQGLPRVAYFFVLVSHWYRTSWCFMGGVLQILGIRHHLLLPGVLLIWYRLVAVLNLNLLYAEQWDLIPSRHKGVIAVQIYGNKDHRPGRMLAS